MSRPLVMGVLESVTTWEYLLWEDKFFVRLILRRHPSPQALV
jgi:hypothetical protein